METNIQALLAKAEAHYKAGRFHDCERICRQILATQPNHPGAQFGLSLVAMEARMPDPAFEHIQAALQSEPGNIFYLNHLGLVLLFKGQAEQAEQTLNRALQLDPNAALTYTNLGMVLMQSHRLAEAMRCFERAIAIKPDNAEAHVSLGHALMMGGDIQRAWRELEWRWQTLFGLRNRLNTKKPHWDGSPLGARRLLVHADQGFGDMIQHARFVRQLVRAGNDVAFLCPPELLKLMKQSGDMGRVLTAAEPMPEFDVHCPLMSLPVCMAAHDVTIDAEIPYLCAYVPTVRNWRKKRKPGLNVGLVWAGRPTHQHDLSRSMQLSLFAPLAGVQGVHFVSVQKGPREKEPAPTGMSLTRVGDQLKDFADTAAVIESLDLIISVDTSVVHLAGALNKPCWVLLPFSPDSRWMLERSDSPWYPSLRLFRQPTRGDWEPVIAEVRGQLEMLAHSRAAKP